MPRTVTCVKLAAKRKVLSVRPTLENWDSASDEIFREAWQACSHIRRC